MKSESLPIANKSPVLSLAYNAGLRMLAIGQMGDSRANPSLSLWDLTTRKEIDVIDDVTHKNIRAACFDYRNKFLIYSDPEKLFLLDISSNKTRALKIDNEKITSITTSKTSGRIIVSGKYAQVLDIDTGKSIWKSQEYTAGIQTKNLDVEGLPAEWKTSKLTFYNEGAIVEIFHNGKTILVGGHNKGTIEEIDIDSGKIIREISPAPVQAYSMSLGCNETVLAVSSKIPYANLMWDVQSGKRLLPEIFNERFGGYSTLHVHPTDRLVASGSLIGFVSVQNLNDGGFIFSKKIHEARVSQVLFSDKSNIVFSGSDNGEVRIIEFDG